MAMGTRKQCEKEEDIWIAHAELASAPGHPFYERLNQLLQTEHFDEFVEGRSAEVYAGKFGRPHRPAEVLLDWLFLPGDRKSVEPTGARLAPDNVGRMHQSLHHAVADPPGKM